MLIVEPIQDKTLQEECCLECNVEYDADLLCYGAWVDSVLVGICQFKLTAAGAHIVDLCKAKGTDDLDALFIMGRQTMNFIDLHGVHKCFFDKTAVNELSVDFAKKLGFSENDGNMWVDLDGFFDSPCEHGKAGSPR